MRGQQAYRVQWMQLYEPDARTGRPTLKAVWPRKVRVRCRTWRERLRDHGDALLYGVFALVFTWALFTGLQ